MSTSAARETPASGRLDAGYLRSLFQGAGIAIIAADTDGRIVACNAAAAKLFAGTIRPEQRLPAADVFPEADRARVAEMVETCLTTLEPGEFQIRLGGTEADPLEFAVYGTPVLEPDGTLLGVSLWLRDITKRKRLLRSVKKNERLAYLGKLSGAVAHHYNNLLCSVATSIEYAMNMNTLTAMRRALQRTAEAIGHGADITRRLLAFAGADHRDDDLSDLTETVLYYFDRVEERLATRHVRLFLDWQHIPTCPVPRQRMLTILENLTENALDVLPNGGTLSVTVARRDEGSVTLSVADTGGGVAPEDMEHLFEPFYTSKGVLGRGASKNAGLGLAVVHGFVSEMGGTITAANVPGSGARFDIVLPLPERE
ncbi:MAG: ATP-binding protein [Phycisphaerae bacterium]|jgi:PAS domain S-box-containing protein